MQMGVFPRLVALALGFSAGAADVSPATALTPAAAHSACQALAHRCPRSAAAPIRDYDVCVSLTLNRTTEYALCWPGAAAARAYPGGRSGKVVLATFHDGDGPCTARGCDIRHRCVCLNAGGEPPAFALTVALPHPPGLHATGCLILGAPPAGTSPGPAVSPIVTLRL